MIFLNEWSKVTFFLKVRKKLSGQVINMLTLKCCDSADTFKYKNITIKEIYQGKIPLSFHCRDLKPV